MRKVWYNIYFGSPRADTALGEPLKRKRAVPLLIFSGNGENHPMGQGIGVFFFQSFPKVIHSLEFVFRTHKVGIATNRFVVDITFIKVHKTFPLFYWFFCTFIIPQTSQFVKRFVKIFSKLFRNFSR